MARRLPMARCKQWLGGLWFSTAAILFLLVILQTIFGKYGANAKDAWGWLLSQIMPTLSLIIGVLVIDALDKGPTTNGADRFLFRLTFGLSVFYLLMVLLPIIIQPFTELGPLELLTQSTLWLAPLQGLVSASLAAFFVKREKS
jgi:hypothetical protein